MDDKLKVKIDYSPKVNFAYQQNAIPVIRRLVIINNSQEELNNIQLEISSNPSFCQNFKRQISALAAGKEYIFNDLPLQLDYSFLSRISEKANGSFTINVIATDNAGNMQSELSGQYQIEVLPYDVWPGVCVMPELLASFVTPNNDVVELIQLQAANILNKRIGDSALSGYQSKNKKHVFDTVNAIFDAVKQIGITYCNPAASFEETGQKIRFAHKIYDSKLATCLDLVVLMCSIMEQCGLNPLILLHEGHAYAGCFLTAESLANVIEDDLQTIRKRSELDELVVFETTLAAGNKPVSFEHAVKAAAKHLQLDSQFHMAIDIKTARSSNVTPLPIIREGLDLSLIDKMAIKPNTNLSKMSNKELKEEIIIEEEVGSSQSRIDNWKRHLLDMTLRNRFLNFRETKQTIPLACNTPDKLEDDIASKRKFKILAKTPLIDGSDPRSKDLLNDDLLDNFLHDELKGGRLRSHLGENELDKRLLALFRVARTDLEEGGVNTLFLALGFLEWHDQGNQLRKAPLILLPVKLGRESARHGFSLEKYDDDASINVTLLEMLKRDYDLKVPGMDNPPEDESGLDIKQIFQLFQQAIKEMKGWEIKEDVWLSRFSFSKFIMWKDLNDRVDDLLKNPIIRHLVNTPDVSYDDGIEGVNAETIDEESGFDQIFCPLSADSSQLAAVISAEKGKTFVLHGPPGTGKSQTITNIIAHCLAIGKRVLFVSEKRAALEVVHKRLCNIGLEPFCLELHSNKSGKMDVLQQFKKSLSFGKNKDPEDWERITNKLNSLRNQLNTYESELHKVYPNGYSVYNSFAYILSKTSTNKCNMALSLATPATMTSGELDERLELCQKLELRYQQLSQEACMALSYIRNTEWNRQWETDLLDNIELLKKQAKALFGNYDELADFLNLDSETPSQEEMYNLLELATVLVEAPVLPAKFAQGNWQEFSRKVINLIARGEERDKLRNELSDFKLEDILGLDIDSMIKAYQTAADRFFIIRWVEQHKIVKLLCACCKVGAGKVPDSKVLIVMEKIKHLGKAENFIKEASSQAQERVGAIWNNGEVDWKQITEITEFGNKLHLFLGNLVQNQEDMGCELRNKVGVLLENASDTLSKSSKFYIQTQKIVEAWNNYSTTCEKLKELTKSSEKDIPHDDNFINSIINLCSQTKRFSSKLRIWSLWIKVRNDALEKDLLPIINAIDSGALKTNIPETFKLLYHEAFIDQIMAQSSILREFMGDEHDSKVTNFKELDKKYSNLSAQLVVAKLAANLPGARGKSAPMGTPIGLIQRECQKKSRHLPVRKLLEKTQSILHNLKPCMLMSPLSIAQYLPANQANFDIVIFDEASQIPVWDSIGAIARAPQCIIVGDPKQLPPTNFFGRNDNAADDDESNVDENNIVELESILDECIAAGLENSYLQWHYRSKHESLIAFSNHHYYENRLYTFPASVNSGIGTKFVYADGIYDKSKTRTNRKEAKILVDELILRLSDPMTANKSIGIVTFSQAQQILIEDLLDAARNKHPEIEKYFTEQVAEPVFVKNLENVQGDERDIIFFSICYARDNVGKLSMNFGPLNRQGGERRLNVAITRAREEVVVFSSIHESDIDLNRTKSLGAAHLKSYLNYAQKGVDALASISDNNITTNEYDSLFEKEVATYLRRQGYNIHTQVGCSGYRIDLAITHPEKLGQYVLGVECDGAAYHSSATARDRDKLRQSVLEGLGWRIHRVWSTAWWHNSDYAKDKLVKAVDEAIVFADMEQEEPQSEDSNTSSEMTQNVNQPYDLDFSTEFEIEETSFQDNEHALEYPRADYSSVRCSQERFYESAYRRHIRDQMIDIINNEGPVIEEILRKRICEQWKFTRAGNNIREILDKCVPSELARTSQNKQRVFWPRNIEPTEYKYFRYPSSQKESKRGIPEIPVEELVNAMYYILTEYRGCKPDILFKESSAIFGVSRVTSKSEPYLETALKGLMENPNIK